MFGIFNLKQINKAAKFRFFCWLIVTAILIGCLIKIIYFGLTLNTNMLDLLPKSKQNPTAEKAIHSFSKTMGNQIVFLIGNPKKTEAQKAADQFFYQLKQSNLFQQFNYLITTNEQQAWGSFYFPYRLSLLTPLQKKLLQENKIKQIQSSALFALYSPIGIANSALLQNDPFFLFQNYLMSRPKPASHVTLNNQRMMIHTNNRWYVMINAQIKHDSFSISNQNKIINLIQSSKKSVLKSFPHTQILMDGMLFYAKAGTDEARRNISTIGIGSLIGIILLLVMTFRSLSPLIFTLMSCFIGFIAAFVVTQYLFGTIYLFTLVFGASLIGIAVDYAFFYYAEQLLGGRTWNVTQGLKNILPGISLGLFNIVLAYIILSFTPFPGLQQLAVFAITGLVMAYITVVCAFPVILKAKKYQFSPPLLKYTNRYLNLWRKLSFKKIVIIYILILIFSGLGIYQLKPNDDIHILESIPTHLKNNEKAVKQIMGNNIGIDFYFVEGNTSENVLVHANTLIEKINRTFPEIPNKYIAINFYIPSISEQKENFHLIKTKLIDHNLVPYLKKIGVKKQKAKEIAKKLSSINFKPLTVRAWLKSPISKSLRFLWLGKTNNKFATVILLSNKLSADKLEKITRGLPFVTYVNKANEISKIFKTYREKISILLIIAYLVLLMLLIVRYTIKKAFFYFLPPLGACALSLAVLGWFGVPLTLFNLLAIILILGIGTDYVLFFAETKSAYQSTMLAVSLSAIATILSFGLLTLSSTPVIHYFGITVLVGITSSFVLSPLVTRIKPKKT